MAVDQVQDAIVLFGPSFRESDAARRAEMRAPLVEPGTGSFWLALRGLETMLGDRQWLVGDAISVADVQLQPLLQSIQLGRFDGVATTLVTEHFPTLAALSTRVLAHPPIAAYYAARA